MARITYRGYALVAVAEPERGWWGWALWQKRPRAADRDAVYETPEALMRAIDASLAEPGANEGGG